MPPLYQWQCQECKRETEVLRRFSDYENPPTEEEVPDTEPQCAGHKWRRLIGANQSLSRGPGWRGAKGHW